MTRFGLLLITATTFLPLGGCTHKAVGQTVAVVNGEEITAGQLNTELARMNVPASVPKDVARTDALQNIIKRRLLVQQAREKGLDKSPEYLDQQRAADESLLIQMSAARQAGTLPLPTTQAIDTFIAANPTAFAARQILTVDQITLPAPTTPAAVQKLRDAHTMEAIAAMLAGLKLPIEKSQKQVDTATIPTSVMKQIAALPPAEPFIVPGVNPGQLVANVIIAHQAAPVSREVARKVAADALRKQQIGQAMDKLVNDLHNSAKIDYQVGYAPKTRPSASPATK